MGDQSTYKRLTINMSPAVHAELVERSERRGISVTELVRRAVALDLFVQENIEGGSRILVEREGERREIVLI